jgi:DnaJ-class molecular chaperone
LKTLYRSLAKRFHPDLARDPEEKAWREERMAEVNAAYAELNMAALEALIDKEDWSPKPSVQSRDGEVAGLYSEITRLDKLIDELDRALRELINSDTVKLMLEVSSARREGWDLLGQMENDLMAQISSLQNQLAEFS